MVGEIKLGRELSLALEQKDEGITRRVAAGGAARAAARCTEGTTSASRGAV